MQSFFRAAYRPAGNGIVERNHRTVKVCAERARITPEEAVYWYNVMPKDGIITDSTPQGFVHPYEWKMDFVKQDKNPIDAHDEVQ